MRNKADIRSDARETAQKYVEFALEYDGSAERLRSILYAGMLEVMDGHGESQSIFAMLEYLNWAVFVFVRSGPKIGAK